MTPSTPQHIITTVVYTLAAMLSVYILTLAVLLIHGVFVTGIVDKEVLTHLQSAGQTLMGVFSGMLINTRTPSQPVNESTQVTTTTSTEPPPTPPQNAQ